MNNNRPTVTVVWRIIQLYWIHSFIVLYSPLTRWYSRKTFFFIRFTYLWWYEDWRIACARKMQEFTSRTDGQWNYSARSPSVKWLLKKTATGKKVKNRTATYSTLSALNAERKVSASRFSGRDFLTASFFLREKLQPKIWILKGEILPCRFRFPALSPFTSVHFFVFYSFILVSDLCFRSWNRRFSSRCCWISQFRHSPRPTTVRLVIYKYS